MKVLYSGVVKPCHSLRYLQALRCLEGICPMLCKISYWVFQNMHPGLSCLTGDWNSMKQ